MATDRSSAPCRLRPMVNTWSLPAPTKPHRRGIPRSRLHFPDENHWVLKPHNSILWHETVMAWLKQWTEK